MGVMKHINIHSNGGGELCLYSHYKAVTKPQPDHYFGEAAPEQHHHEAIEVAFVSLHTGRKA